MEGQLGVRRSRTNLLYLMYNSVSVIYTVYDIGQDINILVDTLYVRDPRSGLSGGKNKHCIYIVMEVG